MDTNVVRLTKLNETYMRVECSKSIAYEMMDKFAFMSENARFDPRVRERAWDGRVRLFKVNEGVIYIGLLLKVIEFCEQRDYQYQVDPALLPLEVPKFNFQKFWNRLSIPANFTIRDYQQTAFMHCVNEQRAILLSPTASGKSLTIYLLAKWYNFAHKHRAVVIVDSLSLVHQMRDDFIEYGADPSTIHTIYAEQSKVISPGIDIVITTWQSIINLDKRWFRQFGVLIGDEVHGFKAESLQTIMKNAESIRYRFGLTGTLDDVQCNEMILTGLFGPVFIVTTTRELIDNGTLADLTISCVELRYSLAMLKDAWAKCKDYQSEIAWVNSNMVRNQFIVDLCKNLKGNKLVLFQRKEKHGKILFDMMQQQMDTPLFYIAGEISGEERNKIRKTIDKQHRDATLVASTGTTQKGVNIVHIDHIIFASGSKSKIRILQSIGRGLRRGAKKLKITVWDLVDNLTAPNNQPNFSMSHFMVRLEHYNKEQFKYTFKTVKLS